MNNSCQRNQFLRERIKLKKIDKIFFVLFLFIQVNFFDLINTRTTFLDGLTSYSSKKILLILVLIYLFFRKPIRDEKRSFNWFICSILVITLMVTIGTFFKFKQGIFQTALVSYYFFIVLLYFPFAEEFNSWNVWHDVVRLFGLFGTILAFSKILQSFFLAKFHILLLYLNTNSDYTTATSLNHMLAGFTRIPSAADFVYFTIVFMVVYELARGFVFSKYKDMFIYFVCFFYLFFVGQTRSYQLLVLAVILIALFLEIRKHRLANFVKLIIGILALCLVPILWHFVSKLFLNSSRSISITIRQEEISYYWSKFFYSGWFSLGFIRDDTFGTLLHGPRFNNTGTSMIGYALDDIGIFGFFGRFGLIGIPVVLTMISDSFNNFKKSKYKNLTVILLVVLFGSWLSTSFLDSQRIFYLPLVLAMMDFISANSSVNDSLEGDTIG